MLVRIDDRTQWNMLAESVNTRYVLALEAVLKRELEALDQQLRSAESPGFHKLQGRANQIEDILTLFSDLRQQGPKP